MSYLLDTFKTTKSNRGNFSSRSGRKNTTISARRVNETSGTNSEKTWRSASSLGAKVGCSDTVSNHARLSFSGSEVQRYCANFDSGRNCEGGQVQLLKTPLPSGQQRQNHGEKQTSTKQGQIDMKEVLHDIAILEQQQLDSQRMLQSVKLTRHQKLKQKASLEIKLSKLKYENGTIRADLHRANRELATRHRQLIDARSRSENSRHDTNGFDVKLKNVIRIARFLGDYRNKIESSMIALNETETRLTFFKGQVMSNLNAATVLHDDAKHRHGLLYKAIKFNQMKEHTFDKDISKIRAEITEDEHDLMSARQMESQTKLRVETIEHELEMERNRHVDVITSLEARAKALDECKTRIHTSIEEKKIIINDKKEELHQIWMKCNELCKSNGNDIMPEPEWGVDQAPSLDVTRIRVRVDSIEVELKEKKLEWQRLQNDVTEKRARLESNRSNASKMQEDAKAWLTKITEGREKDIMKKEMINKAVEDANAECEELELIRQALKDLKATQEMNDIKHQKTLKDKESQILDINNEVKITVAALESVEKQTSQEIEKEDLRRATHIQDLANAKEMAQLTKAEFERARDRAQEFASLPDDELVAEMNQLEHAEEEIKREATRKRSEMIASEPFLDNIVFNFSSTVPLIEQAAAGMASVHQHCFEIIEAAKTDRRMRVEKARDEHFSRMEAEKKERRLQKEREEFRRLEEEKRGIKDVPAATEDKNMVKDGKYEVISKVDKHSPKEEDLTTKKKCEKSRIHGQRKIQSVSEEDKCLKNEATKLKNRRRTDVSIEIDNEDKIHRTESASKTRIEKEASDILPEYNTLDRKRMEKKLEEMAARKIIEELCEEGTQLELCISNVMEERYQTVRGKKCRLMKEKVFSITESEMTIPHQIFEIPELDLRDDGAAPLKQDTITHKRRNINKFEEKDDIHCRMSESQDESLKVKRLSISSGRAVSKNIRNNTEKTEKNSRKDKYEKQSVNLPKSIDNGKDYSAANHHNVYAQNFSPAPSYSSIRNKGLKRPKSFSGVRFDQSANRPKLDIFSSCVHSLKADKLDKSELKKSTALSSSQPRIQKSGISSRARVGGRRKKISSKLTLNSLILDAFEDDGGFL